MKDKLNPAMRQVLKHLVDYHTEQLLTFQTHAHSRTSRVSKPRAGGLRLVTTEKRR
jgi:hypothetical protein